MSSCWVRCDDTADGAPLYVNLDQLVVLAVDDSNTVIGGYGHPITIQRCNNREQALAQLRRFVELANREDREP